MISNSQFQRLRRFFKSRVVVVLSGIVLISLILGQTGDVLADGGVTPPPSCLTDVNNDACLTFTALPYTGTSMPSSWSGAPSKDLTDSDGNPNGTVRFQASDETLYLRIENLDVPSDTEFWLHFDLKHQHDITDVVSFKIDLIGTNHRRATSGDIAGSDDWDTEGITFSSLAPYTIEIELTNTPADLGAMDILPPILGFAIEGVDASTTFRIASWPPPPDSTSLSFSTDTDLRPWANLKTRYPIEYVVVLDQSGSMLGHHKWDDAEKATDLLADTLAALAEPTSMYFNDQFGVITFAWDCSMGVDPTPTDTAVSLDTIPTPFPGGYASALVDPVPNNCTPIGKGLDAGFTTVGTVPEEAERFLLLLSDGFHNRPSDTLLLTDLVYQPCGLFAWGDCSESEVTVHSVAFNPVPSPIDLTVATQLLHDIARTFSGEYAAPPFSVALTSDELYEIFIGSPEKLYPVNKVSHDVTDFSFSLASDNSKLIVIRSWDIAVTDPSFRLTVNGTDNVPCAHSKMVGSSNYAICVVNDPPGGSFTVDNITVGTATPDSQFVLADLSLRARFGIDGKSHGTGEEMILTADLTEKGIPMTAAAGYTVMATVEVARPGEGLGEFLSTRDHDDCEVLDDGPSLPEPGPDLAGYCPFTFGSGLPATVSMSGDPPPPLFNLAGQMLEICEEEGLERVNEPDLILLDDGENGDAQAGDGIYSGRIVPEYEGSYTFRFNVEGTTPTGEEFSRTELKAQYVHLKVDLEHSDMESRIWWQGKDSVIKEFYIIPRDAHGRHLGPGHADQVRFAAADGEWISPVHDYGNGIYARLLQFDKGQDPQVEYIVGDASAVPRTDCWAIVLALIAFLLVLIASSWFLLRKRQMRGDNQ